PGGRGAAAEGPPPDAPPPPPPPPAPRSGGRRGGAQVDPGHGPTPAEPAHESAGPAAGVEDAEGFTRRRVALERAQQEGVEATIPEMPQLETEDAVVLVRLHVADDTASRYLRQRARSAGVTMRARKRATG